MAEIQISGYTVLVDDEDLWRVQDLAWHVGSLGSGRDPYFEHCTWGKPVLRLHRFIMGCDYDTYIADSMKKSAVERQFILIGKALNQMIIHFPE